MIADRDSVMQALDEEGVATALYYPVPLHQLEPCRPFVPPGRTFPIAEAAARTTLAIPFYPEMAEPPRRAVVESLARATKLAKLTA